MSELKVGKYRAYPEYKASGVEWVGCIPSHWKTISVKYIADLVSTGGTPKDSTSFTDENEVPWFSPSDFHNGSSLSSANKYVTWDSVNTKDSKLYKANSVLVIGIGATLGKVAHCLTPFSCNQQINVISPSYRVDDLFLMHALSIQSEQMIQNSNSSTIGIMNQEKTKDLIIVLPAKVEQQKIANFLDHETAKIDTLIEKQQQLIKLLKEKRQAVISHAVTKGLNPNAPMKDSGVEWLGEMPEHWVNSTLKHYSEVIDCKHITAEFFNDGIPLASISEVKKWFVDLSTAKYTSEKYYNELIDGGREPKVGDIIYSRNATVGEAAIVSEGLPLFAMGQDVCLIRLSNRLLPLFAMYVLHSGVISQQLELAMVGSTFKRINVDNIRNFALVIPPLSEQALIVSELETLASKYDVLINNAINAIELMKERRTALISAAVTGKIDVRNWEQPND